MIVGRGITPHYRRAYPIVVVNYIKEANMPIILFHILHALATNSPKANLCFAVAVLSSAVLVNSLR